LNLELPCKLQLPRLKSSYAIAQSARFPIGGTVAWDAYPKLMQREQESLADAKCKRATALRVWRPL